MKNRHNLISVISKYQHDFGLKQAKQLEIDSNFFIVTPMLHTTGVIRIGTYVITGS